MKITMPIAHNSPLVRPVGAVYEGVNECQAGNSPPDTGGVAAPSRKRCAATATAQTGWSGLTRVPFWTTPSAPLKEASRLLLDVASTPPMSGGEWRARKRRLTAVLLMALIWLSACSAKQEEKKGEEAEHVVTVDVAPVLSSPISLKVTTDALLYPLQQAPISPKISAPVKKFYVDRGSHVKAGQLLAELENRDLAGAVSESQASFEQAQANYQSVSKGTVPEEEQKAQLDARAAKEAMDAQQKVYDSRVGLLKEGAISQKEVNDSQVALVQARTQYDIAAKHLQTLQSVSHEQEVKGAAAQRDAAKARTESAQAQLDFSRITSPIDGVVTERPVYAGEMPPSGAPMITVMDLSQIVARAHISLDEAKQIKVGNTADRK